MTGDVTPYTSLITSEHNGKPNFIAMVAALCQPCADAIALLDSVPDLYDLDNAVGEQLDVVGLWIGAGRIIKAPISGIYFSFDTAGQGFDQAVWYQIGDPVSTLVSLPDQQYRFLLYARAVANQWDGTIIGAFEAWTTLFQPLGYRVAIQDNLDMTMGMQLLGPTPDNVIKALFTGGYLDLRPSGVDITSYTYGP